MFREFPRRSPMLLCILFISVACGCTQNTSNSNATTMDSGLDSTDAADTGIGDADTGEHSEVAAPFDLCAPEASFIATTFNIRYAGFSGENAWWTNGDTPQGRRDLVVSTILAMAPDLLGLQEALLVQVLDLKEALPDYGFVGVGRDDGDQNGEFAGIFFRAARFEALSEGHFWMSTTPETPGTVFEGSGSIRISTWAILRDRTTQRELFVINTHWDNASASSRQSSAELTREQLFALAGDLPIVMTGDLNATPESSPVLTLLAAEPIESPALIDGYRSVFPSEGPEERTFHGFEGFTEGKRIDYVLHSDHLRMRSAEIVRTRFDGAYPSDHYPVTSLLGWRTNAQAEACP